MRWQDEPATFAQRVALTNMYQRLGWSVIGIRDMTKGQASAAFEKAKKANDELTNAIPGPHEMFEEIDG